MATIVVLLGMAPEPFGQTFLANSAAKAHLFELARRRLQETASLLPV